MQTTILVQTRPLTKLDEATFTGEEKAEDYTTGVKGGADASLETAAREDRDAAETGSHERPSKRAFIRQGNVRNRS